MTTLAKAYAYWFNSTGITLQPFEYDVDSFGAPFRSSVTTQSAMTNGFSSSSQNAYVNAGISHSVNRFVSGQQVRSPGYGNYSPSPSTFAPVTTSAHDQHTLALYPNSGVNQPYFSDNITQIPYSIDPRLLLGTGDTIPHQQSTSIGMIHFPPYSHSSFIDLSP
jgi:hypothetical protein